MKVLAINTPPEEIRDISLALEVRWQHSRVIPIKDNDPCLEFIETELPDLVILDVSRTSCDGLELIGKIRSSSEVPLIIVTASNGNDVVRISALDKGADDYLIKPFAPMDLICKTVAVMRRCRPAESEREETITICDMTISCGSRQVCVSGNPVKLTPIEFNLLSLLARNQGRVFTHSALLERVWGKDYVDETGFVKKYIHRLRRKLGDDPQNPKMIFSERGVGYRFAKSPKS